MDIITIIVLTGITNLTLSLYSWQQVRNPESHFACKAWAQAQFIKAISFVLYAIALISASDDLRLVANLIIILGCWAEVRAYNQLSGAGFATKALMGGFIVSALTFMIMHVSSAPGPNNVMITTASVLVAIPLAMNVYALYRLMQQHAGSVFPRVLLVINSGITLLCLVRGYLSVDNPDYIITQALFSNQLFMFATFIHGLGNGIAFIGFLKERSDEKLRTRANIDYLTGIYNRQYFERLTTEKLGRDEPFTLYFMDLDKFKSVNDRLGHAAGDSVLQLFAQLLQQQEQHYGAIAGRLGGEEFGLVLPQDSASSHEVILHNLRKLLALHAENLIGEPVTFSLGACASLQATSVQELMRKADVLLYDAKRALHDAAMAR